MWVALGWRTLKDTRGWCGWEVRTPYEQWEWDVSVRMVYCHWEQKAVLCSSLWYWGIVLRKRMLQRATFFFFFPFFSLDNFQGLGVSWVAVWWQLTLWLFQTQSVVGGSPGSVSAGTCWDSCREEEGKKESAELLYFLAVAWVQESWGCSAWGEQPWCLAAAIALCWSVPNTMTALCLGCSCSSLTSIDTLAGNLHGWCTWGLQAGE